MVLVALATLHQPDHLTDQIWFQQVVQRRSFTVASYQTHLILANQGLFSAIHCSIGQAILPSVVNFLDLLGSDQLAACKKITARVRRCFTLLIAAP